MKLFYTHTRVSARWLIPAWLIVFILFSQFAMSQVTVTYSTEAVPAGNIYQNTSNLLYILKVVVGPGDPVRFTSLSLRTTGTYTGTDISQFTLLKGPDAQVANATRIGVNIGFRSGGGETVPWNYGTHMSSVIDLAANSTTYFFVEVTTKLTAQGGKTIGIDGASNGLSINYNRPIPGPTVVNNQSNRAGLQTILAPSVTYTTETLAAGDALKGPTQHLVYILKVVAGSVGTASFTNLSIKTTGTYLDSDIRQFTLYRNSSPSMTGATDISTVRYSYSNGEMLSFNFSREDIAPNATQYYLITAEVENRADVGKTFGINGASNALSIGYINTPTITDNQTNRAGLKTIVGPSVTYTTVPLIAENVGMGTDNRILYILKIVTGSVESVSFSGLSIKTRGSYTSSDISRFALYRNSTPSMTGAQVAGVDISVTGTGETLLLDGWDQRIGSNSTVYYLVTADVSIDATKDRTFGIDGSNNALNISFTALTPSVTNNQTDAAGLRKIVASSVTYSTETLAAGSTLPNVSDHLLYVLKVVTGVGTVTLNNLNIRTTGSYTRSDVNQFTLYRSSTPRMTDASRAGIDDTVTGHGETLSFPGSQTLDANSTTYFLVTANIEPGATDGRTFGINGATNAINITYQKTAPTVVNNQSNVAGLQTVLRTPVTYSTEPLPARNVSPGTNNHLLYVLKVVTGNKEMKFSNLNIRTSGTYTSSDVEGFGLWRSSAPNLTNAILQTGADNAETLSFSRSQTLAANSITYFLVTVNIKSTATAGRTIGINGASNALNITFEDTAPTIVNNQTDVANLQTIVRPTVTYTTVLMPAGTALGGTNNHVLYVLKVETSDVGPVVFGYFNIRTNGTYTSSDIERFKLWRNNRADLTNAELLTSTENAETLSFNSFQTLAASSTTYFLITGDLNVRAAIGHTFGVNGADNSLNIPFTGIAPTVVNNQTDVAGLKTIIGPSVTYSTEPLGAGNVRPAGDDHLLYVIKVVTDNVRQVNLRKISLKTTGTYTSSEIYSFVLKQSSKADMSALINVVASGSPVTGAGETLSFSISHDIPANFTTYYGVYAKVGSGAVLGKTFGIDGANNAFSVDYADNLPITTSVNSQTNVAGLQTIGFPTVTYTTEPLPNGYMYQGAVDQPIYTLKVVMGNGVGATMTNVNVRPEGNYSPEDIPSFNLYQSDTPPVVGGIPNGRILGSVIATANTQSDGNKALTFNTGAIALAAGSTTYLTVRANIARSATPKRFIYVDGFFVPVVLIFAGTSPLITNNQTDIGGYQTIISSLPVTLVSFKAKAEGSVRQLSWETSMEKDNDYFEIQKSLDAKNFSAIGQVKGTAAGYQTHHYSYTDSEAVTEGSMMYYRLKMVDLDKSFTYSRIQSVQMAQSFNVTIFPNPVSESFTLETTDWEKVKTVKMFNLTGTTVYNSAISGLRKSIEVGSMGEGMYVVELLFKNGQTKSSRIMVTK